MSRVYTPDTWQLLLFSNGTQDTLKVFGCWYGGYTSGDSWKLSSGVVKHYKKDGSLYFENYSGSIYICNPKVLRLSVYHANVLDSLFEQVKTAGHPYALENVTDKYVL